MGRKRNARVSIDPFYWSKRMSSERRRGEVLQRTRHTLLGSGGRYWHGLNKRPYPNGTCELCGNTVERMHYHHWDDEHPSLGLWLCGLCHRWAEGFDQVLDRNPLVDTYAGLKDAVSRTYHESRLL